MTTATISTARDDVRAGYLVAGAALTALAVAGAVAWGTGASSVLLFAVLPDLAFLLAIGQPAERGQLPSRAVPAYNLMHRPVLPLVLLGASVAGLLSQYWLVASLAWGAHLAFDRGCGYGLRTKDGWQRG